MSAIKVLGSADPVVTSVRKEQTDREATIVEVEGKYSQIETLDETLYCPAGLTVESSYRQSTGDGMGKLTVKCVKYDTGFSFGAERTTIRIDMQEVSYDLEDHPYLEGDRDTIIKWLATDEGKRCKEGTYYCKYYKGDKIKFKKVKSEKALKFINAYMSGIKNFVRYYPVIEKISVWKNPPGMNRLGRSFTSGSPLFSSEIGKFSNPPLTLNGYPLNHWFKSKDSWVQSADTTWTRTEQWTYSPVASNGEKAWIYNNLT